MRFSRLSAMTMPSTCGTAPPDRLVPLPRATNGTPASAQRRTTAMTSSAVSGRTTARGRARNAVRPSDSKAARPAAAVTIRAGGTTRAIAGSNSEGPTVAMVVVRGRRWQPGARFVPE